MGYTEMLENAPPAKSLGKDGPCVQEWSSAARKALQNQPECNSLNNSLASSLGGPACIAGSSSAGL